MTDTKKIEDLVPDIYNLLVSGTDEIDEQKVSDLGSRISSIVASRLSKEGREVSDTLRMSNAGTACLRKLWYTCNKPEKAEPLPSHTLLNFLYGDVIEQIVLFLAEQAGHDVQGVQDEVSVAGIKGHRDAVIDGTTVDVKSANSRSFDKFKYHELDKYDPFAYRTQLDLYVTAGKDDPLVTNKDSGAFLAFDKELGHMVLDEYVVRPIDYEQDLERVKAAVNSDKLPPRAYQDQPDGASGNKKLAVECAYCAFKKTCWPGLRTFLYSNGPRYLTTVVREPDVKEI